jgi:hypothetical protein
MSEKLAARRAQCHALLKEKPHLQAHFTVSEAFAKLSHTASGRDFLPSEDLDQFLKKFTPDSQKKALHDAEELQRISRFLQVNKFNPNYLFCTLTKKKLPNTIADAHKHTDGTLYMKKQYEHWKAAMIKRKRQYELELRQNRRNIENGKHGKLQSGRRVRRIKHDPRNVLYKGYPRWCKYQRLMRYSRLIIMGLH